jgi:exo-beta-1,3-glucanase (GH17 family)
MKRRLLSRRFQILSQLVCLGLMGCSSSVYPAKSKKAASDCYSNYVLGNGHRLLGNNDYPAISFSGYRTLARTVENCPTIQEIQEDLKILSAMGIKLLRTYNTQEFPDAARTLQAIKELKQTDPNFEMYVMLGTWIRCKGAYGPTPDHTQGDAEWNKLEIDGAIELASQYPDVVKIVAVGNEAMVTWQAHFVPPSVILSWVSYLKQARTTGKMPAKTLVTTSETWAALGGAESYHNRDLVELLKQVDFVSLHTYAFHDTYYDPAFKWSVPPEEDDLSVAEQAARAAKRAIAHQIAQCEAVKSYMETNGIYKQIHIGETGWASLDDSFFGADGTCAADEYKAKFFYDAVKRWTTENNLTCFYFEGFDEPWKSNGTDGSEGHFGLFTVDGRAKFPLWNLVDAGVFDGLTRGGNAITKTHDGNEAVLLAKVKAPAFKKHQ